MTSTNGRARLRSFAALAEVWRATWAPTEWKVSRRGNPTRRLVGGVAVTIERDRRTGEWRVRHNGGRGGVWRERFATEHAARCAVDGIEAHR